MDRKRRFSRLGSKLVGVSVLGLLLAFAVFWLADNAAVPWLLHSDWFIRAYRERNEAAVQAYQDYVTEQGFTVRQVQEDRDGRLAEGIYTVMAGLPLSIEVTDKSVSSSAVWDGDIRYSFVWAETAGTEADIAAASEVAVDMYPIQCADGAVHIFAAPAALRYAGLGRVAGLLLGQLLEEQCGDLRREGFDVRPPAFERDFQLYLSTADAVRIFDNLFSNLKKYADSAVPVRIQAEDGPETVTLRVANRVRPVPDRTDSHGVGVPTMRELLERAGGRLEIFLHGDAYESVLAFPKYRA